MNVTVDDDRCGGHGICCQLCPEVFTLGDDGYAVVETPEVPAEFEDVVRTAVLSCPARAISVS